MASSGTCRGQLLPITEAVIVSRCMAWRRGVMMSIQTLSVEGYTTEREHGASVQTECIHCNETRALF